MNPYDDDIDYCGPNGCRISRLISRRIFGVDMNRACYQHDCLYEAGGTEHQRKFADLLFYHCMKLAISRAMKWYNPLRIPAYLWALRRYHAVRWFGKRSFNYHE